MGESPASRFLKNRLNPAGRRVSLSMLLRWATLSHFAFTFRRLYRPTKYVENPSHFRFSLAVISPLTHRCTIIYLEKKLTNPYYKIFLNKLLIIFSTVSFKITCLLYWSLYLIDPKLVIPDWAISLIPSFLNQVSHTAPIPFILVDTLLTCHHAPPLRTGFVVSLAIVCIYYFM